jgi:hypothetical protein
MRNFSNSMTLRLGCAISKQLGGFRREDLIATSPGEEGRGGAGARFITGVRGDHSTVGMRARSGDGRAREARCFQANPASKPVLAIAMIGIE